MESTRFVYSCAVAPNASLKRERTACHVARNVAVPFVNADPTPRGPANRERTDCDGGMDEVFRPD